MGAGPPVYAKMAPMPAAPIDPELLDTAVALLRVDRQSGHTQRLEVAPCRALADLELVGHLARGHLTTRLQHHQDGHESVGTHVSSLVEEPATA